MGIVSYEGTPHGKPSSPTPNFFLPKLDSFNVETECTYVLTSNFLYTNSSVPTPLTVQDPTTTGGPTVGSSEIVSFRRSKTSSSVVRTKSSAEDRKGYICT